MTDNRSGLVIAHIQTMVPSVRGFSALARQRSIIGDCIMALAIRIDGWHVRAKGLRPLPTIEDLIVAGRVYAVVASEWSKTRGCRGYWQDLGPLCEERNVRRVYVSEEQDLSFYGEPNAFIRGRWVRTQVPAGDGRRRHSLRSPSMR